MIRTFCDHQRQAHTRDLEQVLGDNVRCIGARAQFWCETARQQERIAEARRLQFLWSVEETLS